MNTTNTDTRNRNSKTRKPLVWRVIAFSWALIIGVAAVVILADEYMEYEPYISLGYEEYMNAPPALYVPEDEDYYLAEPAHEYNQPQPTYMQDEISYTEYYYDEDSLDYYDDYLAPAPYYGYAEESYSNYYGISAASHIPNGYISNTDGLAMGMPVMPNPFVLDTITFTGFGANNLPAGHATTQWPAGFAGQGTRTTPGGRTTVSPGFHGAAYDGMGGLWFTNWNARDTTGRHVLMRMCTTTGEMQMYRNWPTTTAHGLTTPIANSQWHVPGGTDGGNGLFSTIVIYGGYVWIIPELINAVVRVCIHSGPNQQMMGFNNWASAGITSVTPHSPNFRGGTIFTDIGGSTATYLVMTPYHPNPSNNKIIYMDIYTGIKSYVITPTLASGEIRTAFAMPDSSGGLWFDVQRQQLARLDLAGRTIEQFPYVPGPDFVNDTGRPFGIATAGGITMRGGIYDVANGYIWMFPSGGTHILRVTACPILGEGDLGFIRAINLPPGVPYGTDYIMKFSGGGFDGRFVYIMPDNLQGHPPRMVRLDTQSPDLNNPDMVTFDFNEIAAEANNRDNAGMWDYTSGDRPNFGAAFDGHNLWLAPFQADRIIRISQYLSVDMSLDWAHIGDVLPPAHNQQRIYNANDGRIRVTAINDQRAVDGAVSGRITRMDWVRVPLANTANLGTTPAFNAAFAAAAAAPENRGTQLGPDFGIGSHSPSATYYITANRNANYWVRVTFAVGESEILFTEIRHIVVDNIYTPIEVRHRGLQEGSSPQVFLYTGALATAVDAPPVVPPRTLYGIPFDFGNPAVVINPARLGFDTITMTAQDHTATGWRLRATGENATPSPKVITLNRPTSVLIADEGLTAPVSPATYYNFTFLYYNFADWIRLNHAINIMNPPPAEIVIHPTGGSFAADTIVGSTLNLVVTDPGDGSTITTLAIPGAPASNPHSISVNRNVIVRAANGADIILRMPVVGFPNTPNQAPWNTNISPNLGRHFIVNGGNFVFGGGGHIALDGNVLVNDTPHAGNRGGVDVNTGGQFEMRGMSIIANCRAVMGGGVQVLGGQLNMYGGIIGSVPFPNMAQYGGGVYVQTGQFNLRGTEPKIITGNRAVYDGGGIWVAAVPAPQGMRMPEGAGGVSITHNHAGRAGGGIFSANYEHASPLTRTPPGVAPLFYAYSNLTLRGVTFGNNIADTLHWPPVNGALVIPATAFVASTTSQPPIATGARRHPLNNFDINFAFTPEPVPFYFLKTDPQLYANSPVINLLAGAQFRVFRSIEPGITLGTCQNYLITPGAANPWWEEVEFTSGQLSPDSLVAASGATGGFVIGFEMDPQHYYQIVEILAPEGYQIPFGQWRVSFDIFNNVYRTPIAIGGMAPEFIFHQSPRLSGATHPVVGVSGWWYVGNLAELSLPMTGGGGISTYVMAGTGAVILAMLVAAYFMKGRRCKHEKGSNHYSSADSTTVTG